MSTCGYKNNSIQLFHVILRFTIIQHGFIIHIILIQIYTKRAFLYYLLIDTHNTTYGPLANTILKGKESSI